MAKARRQKIDLTPDSLPVATPERLEPRVGPSDSSDSASDLIGTGLDGSSDRQGTGERATAGQVRTTPCDSDLTPDRIVGESEAGLGGGLDQAEEAQLGITDEEIAEQEARESGLD